MTDQQILAMIKCADKLNSNYKMIVGDFNFPDIDWVNLVYPPSKDEFMDAVLELNLQQHVLQPTRYNAILI